MHAIQTSGNCIRNVTADHFAGAAADEIADPRPYAEILRQWSSLHPEFSFLPRKFKIAVSGTPHDRAAVQVHDIGLQIVRNAAGEIGFTVYVGGGLGRTPMIAHKVRDFLPEADLLAYSDAILRVYNLEGRRDNKFKARIKILVHEKGARGDARRGRGGIRRAATGARLRCRRPRSSASAPISLRPISSSRAEAARDHAKPRGKDARFDAFVRANVVAHKVPGYGSSPLR